MKNLALRDFQQKGRLSVDKNQDEPILLTNRSGPVFFLIPVESDNIENQYRELLRAMAQANLRHWQNKAEELEINEMSQEEINAEIAASRKARKKKK